MAFNVYLKTNKFPRLRSYFFFLNRIICLCQILPHNPTAINSDLLVPSALEHPKSSHSPLSWLLAGTAADLL